MSRVRFVSRAVVTALCAAVLAGATSSCRETTAAPLRYPVLDDEGHSDWRSVSVGAVHTCGLKADGTAFCWGSNRYGQLGVLKTDTTCGSGATKYPCSVRPQRVELNAKFAMISAGQNHTCGITTLREAYCWGANDQGQLGSVSPGGPIPARIDAPLPWTQISAGFSHSCGVRTDGTVACWGENDRGQIGVGNFFNSGVPARISFNEPVAEVSAGQGRSCARTLSNRVYCWGAIWLRSQDGLELSRSQATPQAVPGSPNIVSLSVGALTTCGTGDDGRAYCWEANPRGERGDGTFDGSTAPDSVIGGLQFVQISTGIVQTCGIAISGAGYCWGDDTFGQLGVPGSTVTERCSGTLPCSSRPVAVLGRQSFVEISTGPGSHTCGVTTQGNLYCWGLGQSGQRGDGTMGYAISTPLTVSEPR